MRSFPRLVFILALAALRPTQAAAAPAVVERVPNRLVVRLAPAAAQAAARPDLAAGRAVSRVASPALSRLAARWPAARFEPLFPGEPRASSARATRDLSAFWLVRLPANADPLEARATLASAPDVASVEADAWLPVERVPDDSLWAQSWHLSQSSGRDIAAPAAWDLMTGDSAAVIAIIDTGILRSHPDLGGSGGEGGKMWRNAAEANGAPGEDDDHNGYVDDTWGWDFVDLDSVQLARPGEDWRDEDPDPNDFASHGTAVAGIVAAITDNGIGVAGVAWGARIMALRAGWSSPYSSAGMVDMVWAARAILYAARNGATVINCSFASVASEFLAEALDEAREAGVSVVAAAGNNGLPDYIGERSDALAVTATDRNDAIPPFAELGARVDLAAPGVELPAPTCRPGTGDSLAIRVPSYTAGATGTSFSAPLVSGTIALLQSLRRSQGVAPLHPMEVLYRVRENTDDIHLQAGATGYGTGRLDASRVLLSARRSTVIPIGVATVGPGIVMRQSWAPPFALWATQDGRIVSTGVAGDTSTFARLPAAPFGGLAAADLWDGGGAGLFVATANGWLMGFDSSGQPLPGWPVAIPAEGSVHEPALGDLDGDGALEVLWGSAHGKVYAFRAEGTAVPGFPVTVPGATGEARVAIGDLDGAAGAEIAVTTTDGRLAVFWGSGERFPTDFPALGRVTPPAIAWPTGQPAVIVVGVDQGARFFYLDGRLAFSATFDGIPIGAPAIDDPNGDGRLDAIIVTRARPLMNIISWVNGSVITADLDEGPAGGAIAGALQAGSLPLAMWPVANQYNELPMVARSYFGKAAGRFPQPGATGGFAMLVDWDDDGASEVLVGAGPDGMTGVLDAGPSTWRNNGGRWPMAGANWARTSNTAYTPRLSTLTNERPDVIADLRGGSATTTGVWLSWTAPALASGTGRVAGYDLRRSGAPLDSATFLAATPAPTPSRPAAPGAPETVFVPGLGEGAVHHFAIRSRGPGGSWSAISADLSVSTLAIPPAAPRALAIIATRDSGVTLRWLAGGDDDTVGVPARYELRAVLGAPDSAALENASLAIAVDARLPYGEAEEADFAGLARGLDYSIAARTVDRAGRRSAWCAAVATDATPPAAVTPLTIDDVAADSVMVSWNASGDDGVTGTVARYDVRAAEFALDDAAFERAPLRRSVAPRAAPGARERAWFPGIERGRHWWIAARAMDEAGNRSPLSNVVETDAIAPAMVRGLALDSLVAGRLAIHWEATGDDGRTGRPRGYYVYAEFGALDSTRLEETAFRHLGATANAGGIERAAFNGSPGRDVSVAIVAEDEAGLRSPPSAVLRTDLVPPDAPAAFAIESVGAAGVVLRWNSSGDDGALGHATRYELRAANVAIGEPEFALAPFVLDVLALAPHGGAERATFPGISSALPWWFAIRAFDDLGNPSSIPPNLHLDPTAPTAVADFRLVRRAPAGAGFAWAPAPPSPWVPVRYRIAVVPRAPGIPNFTHAALQLAVSAGSGTDVVSADFAGLTPGGEYLAAIRAETAAGDSTEYSASVVVPAFAPVDASRPEVRALGAPATAVRFAWQVPSFRRTASWRLEILDVTGRRCRTLALSNDGSGIVEWDGRDDEGIARPPGLYWARLAAGIHSASARFILLR